MDIAQDREQPRHEAGALSELGALFPSPHQRGPDHVVGLHDVAGAQESGAAQVRHEGDHPVAERLRDLPLRLRVEQGGSEPEQNPTEPRIGLDRARSEE